MLIRSIPIAAAKSSGSSGSGNLDTGEVLLSVEQPGKQTGTVTFYPNGKSVIIGDMYRAKVINAATGAVRFATTANNLSSIPINESQNLFATDGDVFWDLADGHSRTAPVKAGGNRDVAFSPDGRLACIDLTLWDLASGEKIGNFPGLNAPDTTMAAFSHDGRFVVGGAGLWSVENLETVWSRSTRLGGRPPVLCLRQMTGLC